MPWDEVPMGAAMVDAAMAAANAAANGGKSAAYIAQVRTDLGSDPVVELLRDDVIVYAGTLGTSVSLVGTAIKLTQPTSTTLVSADIDTGDWFLRVRNKTDSGKFIAARLTNTAGAGPMKLSQDLSGAMNVGSVLFNAPTLDVAASTAATSATGWLDALYDSMVGTADGPVNSDNPPQPISADGGLLPFPAPYSNFTSSAGVRASMQPLWNGSTGRAISLAFTDGMDAIVPWAWFYASQGHGSTQSWLRVSNMACAILRESTRTWQIIFQGARAYGHGWLNKAPYITGPDPQDLSRDPRALFIKPSGGYGFEVWPEPNNPNTEGIVGFYGAYNGPAVRDCRALVISCDVEVIGPDRAASRFIGNIGWDVYRVGGGGRYDSRGYPFAVMDGGGGRWRSIRTDGQKQSICAISCFELLTYKGISPPWAADMGVGDYQGTWPYSSPPAYGPSWAEILANPPPDLRG